MADPPTKNVRKQVSRNTGAIEVISDRDNPVFRRISSDPIGRGSGSQVTRAALTAAAGSGTTITATLFKSDGTTGDAITVHFNLSRATDLNECLPRFESGDEIFVTRSTFDNAGMPESRWYCTMTPHGSEDCVCSE
jgi:hypothetical protein